MNNIEFAIGRESCNTSENLPCTSSYIEKYLNPDRSWEKDIPPKERIKQIQYANVNWRIVSDHIKSMDYQSFLQTPYWKAIAAHTKYKAGYRCQLCNSPRRLITHHRNYDIHGFEHAYMQDLTVLCDDCHNKFHDRPQKRNFKTHHQSRKPTFEIFITSMVLSLFFVYFLIEHANILKLLSCFWVDCRDYF